MNHSAASPDIYVSGRYAYVAQGGLTIKDIADPSAPTNKAAIGLSDQTNGVYVSGKYAYVLNSGIGLIVIDVSNPGSPFIVSTINLGTTPNKIFVSGRYAYVATGGSGLKIIDIGGLETHALYAGNIESNDITVTENVDIGNNLYVRNGINAGIGGIFANGPLALTASYSYNTRFNIKGLALQNS